jgi:dienelactone hydrolase
MTVKNFNSSLLLTILLAALTCAAKESPVPQVVDLRVADGTKLKASYFSAGNPGPGILLLHQCDHERKIWDGLAQQLAAAGFHILTFDLRGFGESGGEPHEKTPPKGPPDQIQKWPGDIDAALHYLKSRPGVNADVIGVGGASCGVNNAIQTAMRHSEVKSLVLLAGPAELTSRQFLRQSNLPAFFSVADDDPYPGMVQWTEWLYMAAAGDGKEFVHYQTGRHGAEIFSLHPDLPAAIVDWYVTTLFNTPGQAPVSKEVPSILGEVQILNLLDQTGGPAKAEQLLAESRQKDPKAPFPSEAMMYYVGEEYWKAGDNKRALQIMRMAVLAYPNSPVVHFGLAYGYLGEGQKDLARQNFQKTLELLPSDTVYPQSVHDSIKGDAEQQLQQSDTAK